MLRGPPVQHSKDKDIPSDALNRVWVTMIGHSVALRFQSNEVLLPSYIIDDYNNNIKINPTSESMIKEYDHLFKTVIIGNSGVGKSSVLVRFAENQFMEHYLATIGVDFRFKTLQVDGKNIKYQIWDTAGQQRFRTITSAYYRGSQGILMVFDLTDQQSFIDITNFWMGEVDQYAQKDAVLILVGNKADLVDNRKVSEDEIKIYCQAKGINYVECSAKEDYKIKDVFSTLARTLMKKQDLKNLSTTPKKGKGLTESKTAPKKGCC